MKITHYQGGKTWVTLERKQWTDQEIADMKVIYELRRVEDARVWNNAGLVGYLIWLYKKFRWAMHNSKYFNNIGKDFRDDNSNA